MYAPVADLGIGGDFTGSADDQNGENERQFHLAICGVGIRLPGDIRNTEAFWNSIITALDAQISGQMSKNKDQSTGGHASHESFLSEGHGSFDSAFSMTKDTSIECQPYDQKLLEVTRECLEDACEINYNGSGAAVACYVAMPPGKDGTTNGAGLFPISKRISLQYDFQGPNMTIESVERSASLSALHEACNDIKNGVAKAALVAGINLTIASDADVAAFEREAVAAVFIKPLSDAIRDGNPIQAVIRASSTYNDQELQGPMNLRVRMHEAMILEAYDAAGLDPRNTAFIECLDTDLVANEVEFSALGNVFGENDGYLCSTQGTIGDLKSASGLMSLIKAMISLKHQMILPSVTANMNGHLPGQKLTLLSEPLEFPSGQAERASINYLGAAGLGAHVIIELYGENCVSKVNVQPKDGAARPELVLYSANNVTSLNQQIQLHHDYAKAHPERVSDIAYTRAIRREASSYRAFSILGNDGRCINTTNHAKSPAAPSSIVMVFSGQGAQWAGMGKELLQFDEFRNDIKSMDIILQQLKNPPSWTIEEEMQRSSNDPLCRIDSVEFACMLSTALQIALLHLFERLGAKPEAVVGHSSGEIAAAYAAGHLTLVEAITVAYYYGYVAAMSESDGAMAVTGLSAEETVQFLRDGVVVACENSPASTTISGDRGVLEEVIASIQRSRPQVITRKLHVNTAFHSQRMQLVANEFLTLLEAEEITLAKQTARQAIFVSSVSNCIINAVTPSYWMTNLVSPVRFSSAVGSILDVIPKNSLFLEIGPHSTLSSPLSQICNTINVPCNYVSSQYRGNDSQVSFLSAIGRLWQASVDLKLEPLFNGKATPGLPQYPWNYSDYDESSLSYAHGVILSAKDKRNRLISGAASMTSSAISSTEVPKTELELVLRALWADVLRNVLQVRMVDIGRQDNFFLLGGDSLNSMELVTAAYRHGIRLSPIDIAQNPELMQMAAVATIDEAEATKDAAPFSLIPKDSMENLKVNIQEQCKLQAETIEDITPCTALQEGFLALGLKQPGSYIHRQVYRLMPHVDIDRFVASWDAVIKHYGTLRSRIALCDSHVLQAVVTTDNTWENPVSNLDVDSYLSTTRSIPMSYGDRLSRYTLLYQDNDDIYFIWIAHHAVFDGLSMKIVLDALHKAYNGAELEVLSPYSNYIRYVESLDSNSSIQYWSKELEGAHVSQFPDTSVSAKSQDCIIKRSMPFQNPKSSMTTATIVRAAWALVLAQYSGSDDVCFGMTLSGRQAPVPGLSETVGPTIATVPVRVKINREMLVSEFLHHIQSHASSMIPYETLRTSKHCQTG